MNKAPSVTLEELRPESYERPAVEERAPISAPLKTVAQTRELSPRWRRTEND